VASLKKKSEHPTPKHAIFWVLQIKHGTSPWKELSNGHGVQEISKSDSQKLITIFPLKVTLLHVNPEVTTLQK